MTRTEEYATCLRGGSKSRKFSEYYGRIAKELGCVYFDTAPGSSSPVHWTGVHLEAAEHAKLGKHWRSRVEEILGE